MVTATTETIAPSFWPVQIGGAGKSPFAVRTSKASGRQLQHRWANDVDRRAKGAPHSDGLIGCLVFQVTIGSRRSDQRKLVLRNFFIALAL